MVELYYNKEGFKITIKITKQIVEELEGTDYFEAYINSHLEQLDLFDYIEDLMLNSKTFYIIDDKKNTIHSLEEFKTAVERIKSILLEIKEKNSQLKILTNPVITKSLLTNYKISKIKMFNGKDEIRNFYQILKGDLFKIILKGKNVIISLDKPSMDTRRIICSYFLK